MSKTRIFTIVRKVAIVFILLMLCATGFLSIARVSGSSMRPTFLDGSFGISVKLDDYQYGDVVLAKVTIDGKEYDIIKRIMGKRGDVVSIKGSECCINGNPAEWQFSTKEDVKHTVVGDYYLLGDNRDVSTDSRDFGDVMASQIYGKYYDIASSNQTIALACVTIFALVVLIL